MTALEAAWFQRIEAGCSAADAIKIDALLARVSRIRRYKRAMGRAKLYRDRAAEIEAKAEYLLTAVGE